MARYKQTDIYNNWQMLSPDDVLISRVSQKRAEWYLRRDIAELRGEKVIRLKFEPNGKGNLDVPFLLEEKQNICVVCGCSENLNRHHVVPYQYRRYMPEEDKGHSSYDVLPICLKHHDEYEEMAQEYSRELAVRYDAPFSSGKMSPEDSLQQKMHGLLKVIAAERPVPEWRLAEIRSMVNEFYMAEIDRDRAAEILRDAPKKGQRLLNGKPHGQIVVEKVLLVNGLQEFIESWRLHFTLCMNPLFLSPNWKIDHAHR